MNVSVAPTIVRPRQAPLVQCVSPYAAHGARGACISSACVHPLLAEQLQKYSVLPPPGWMHVAWQLGSLAPVQRGEQV